MRSAKPNNQTAQPTTDISCFSGMSDPVSGATERPVAAKKRKNVGSPPSSDKDSSDEDNPSKRQRSNVPEEVINIKHTAKALNKMCPDGMWLFVRKHGILWSEYAKDVDANHQCMVLKFVCVKVWNRYNVWTLGVRVRGDRSMMSLRQLAMQLKHGECEAKELFYVQQQHAATGQLTRFTTIVDEDHRKGFKKLDVDLIDDLHLPVPNKPFPSSQHGQREEVADESGRAGRVFREPQHTFMGNGGDRNMTQQAEKVLRAIRANVPGAPPSASGVAVVPTEEKKLDNVPKEPPPPPKSVAKAFGIRVMGQFHPLLNPKVIDKPVVPLVESGGVGATLAEEKKLTQSPKEVGAVDWRQRLVMNDSECAIGDVLNLSGYEVWVKRLPPLEHDETGMFGAAHWAILGGSTWPTTPVQQTRMKSVLTSAALDLIKVEDTRCTLELSKVVDLAPHWKLTDLEWLVAGRRTNKPSASACPFLWLRIGR
jgi:hypothetical protein